MAATVSISKTRLMDLTDQFTDGHVSYKFGAKPLLTQEVGDIKSCDCSGFVRYVLYHSSDQQIKIASGSWHQEEWCKTMSLPEVDYSTAGSSDGWLRIAFLPKKNGKPRHVWFVLNGLTIESRGGKGPDRRAWDTPGLKKNAHACFKLAQLYSLDIAPTYRPWGSICFPA